MSNAVRKIILDQSHRKHVGHIGSCLSIADIVSTLYDDVISISAPDDNDRDRVVLSKGHAALALYAALAINEIIPYSQLDTFLEDDSYLGVHPEHQLPGIDFSTGSLGQGLSLATGAALAAKMQKSKRKVFAIVSDAELNEGSTWEALMFAAHHKLSQLTAIIDYNKQQAFGFSKDVIDMSRLPARLESFGCHVIEADGHDKAALQAAMQHVSADGKPTVVVAHTTFGKGVSYMEKKIKWHYMPMSDAEYQQAIAEVAATDA